MSLPLRQALALGLLHGPTELLPISSAGHTALVPWLAGWPYGQLDGELRKSFEVALHAGTAAALALRPPTDGTPLGRAVGERASSDPPRAAPVRLGVQDLVFLTGAVVPPAAVGYFAGERIERQFGTPATIAAGLLAGSLAMAWGEIRAVRRGGRRPAVAAGARDGLAIGVAQAIALVPGVSRSGAAYAAARARGFGRLDADRLSWRAGLPVIGGATVLQAGRFGGRGSTRRGGAALAVGAGGAFASTLLATRLLGPRERTAAIGPACVYRTAVALAVLARLRRPLAAPPLAPNGVVALDALSRPTASDPAKGAG